ncbi:MAG: RNA polymerase sigma-70 factor [Rubrobacteraceae bacterium]
MGKTEDFDRHRPLLFSVAYRMLGSVADAEDVLQEAYLRWQRVADSEVRAPGAYLSTVVTRLSIDHLRSAHTRREEYVGAWLPEPLLTEGKNASDAVAEAAILGESLSMAFLVLLESLTPTERAVFLLREVFDYDYGEVSHLVGKSEDNCRQISRRARQSVAARRPRFESSPEQEERLMESFLEACASGDMEALISLLAEDVIVWSDGGGKVRAALRPIHGARNAARFFFGILGKAPPGLAIRRASINSRPGVVGYFADGSPQSVVTLDVEKGSIRAIHIVVNPEKLANIPPLEEVER